MSLVVWSCSLVLALRSWGKNRYRPFLLANTQQTFCLLSRLGIFINRYKILGQVVCSIKPPTTPQIAHLHVHVVGLAGTRSVVSFSKLQDWQHATADMCVRRTKTNNPDFEMPIQWLTILAQIEVASNKVRSNSRMKTRMNLIF